MMKNIFSKQQVQTLFAMVIVLLGLGFSQHLHAQMSFAAPVSNPYNLDSTFLVPFPTAVDLDNDGDLDLVVGSIPGSFNYQQNIGSASAPNFAAAVTNPFGLVAVNGWTKPTFADLDNDGDFDLLVSETNSTPMAVASDMKYFENIGTASAPNFAAPLANPFGLATSVTYFRVPRLVDLDGDGDFDIVSIQRDATATSGYSYIENTGSVTAPNFGASVLNPFGMSMPFVNNIGFVDFTDVDSDGDLDMMFGENDINGNFYYYQNIGSVTNPNFTTGIINPFGLVATNQSQNTKKKYPCIFRYGCRWRYGYSYC